MLTPYQFASNRPIDGIDLDGLEYVGSTTVDGDPPVVLQSAYAITDFIANTVSAGMNIINKPAEGRAIRRQLEKAGYNVSYLSDQELAEEFNLKMITGGTVENPQRGWTVMASGSYADETLDYALGALAAFGVYKGATSGGTTGLLARSPALVQLSKNARALITGGKNTTVNVKSFKEADELLEEAFPGYQKVRGMGNQDAVGINKQKKMHASRKPGTYHKDYAIDEETGKVRGHDGPNATHGEHPHINIKRKDGTKVVINIVLD
jgi:hypothetical protein